jgi:hypothetical protein
MNDDTNKFDADMAAYFDAEADRHNDLAKLAYGSQIDADSPDETEPGHDEALAHLRQMPEKHAVAKAREWTGRTNITNMRQALAAVREMLTRRP